MLDPALFRDPLPDVQVRLSQRGGDLGGVVEELRRLDAERRAIIPVLEDARRAKKELGVRIGTAKRGGQPVDGLVAAGQQHGATIEAQEGRLEGVERARTAILMRLPNLAHESVPVGATEAQNVEVRRHRDPPVFQFEARAHWDLGPALGVIDFERGVKLAGARFSVLMGAGARLARALINFMLELHTGEHGYTEVAAAVSGQCRVADRHRAAAEVRGGPVQDRWRAGPVPHPDRRGAALRTCTEERFSPAATCR